MEPFIIVIIYIYSGYQFNSYINVPNTITFTWRNVGGTARHVTMNTAITTVTPKGAPHANQVFYFDIIPYTDWAYNAHSVPFEQSKNAHSVPSLSGVVVSM